MTDTDRDTERTEDGHDLHLPVKKFEHQVNLFQIPVHHQLPKVGHHDFHILFLRFWGSARVRRDQTG